MRIFYITAPVDQAETIARQLLEARLIACANIVPSVRSLYWWKDEIQNDEEALIIVKTRADLANDLIAKVAEIHPYEVPETIGTTITEGNAEYLKWLGEETGG